MVVWLSDGLYLERINIPQSVLHMAVHNQFAQTENLTTQVERIPETGLLTLLQKNVKVNKPVQTD